jgi:hypothetical protein
MKYWVLHILLVSVIISVWLFSYNGYFDTPQPKQTMQIETIDTMLYEVPIARDVFDTIYIEPLRMMMILPDTSDTSIIAPPPPIIEPEPIIITLEVIDTIYDTVYVRVPIHQPNNNTIQQSSILDNVEVLVTIIGGFLNMLLGFFQLKERKKQN